MEDLTPDDIIVALMGSTGTGKTSFISMATGRDTGIGHDLETKTKGISILRFRCFERSSQDVVFVDTPSFDDTYKSDARVLKLIEDWLKNTKELKVKLSAVLYCHRISDNRMAATPIKQLHTFKRVCGENGLRNIILTTTMWDIESQATAERHERELTDSYWRTMIAYGSETARHFNTEESAWKILDGIVRLRNDKYSMDLQRELVDLGQRLPETGAACDLFRMIESLVSRQQAALQHLRTLMSMKHQDDESFVSALKEEYEGLRGLLELTILDIEMLKIPLGTCLRRFSTSRLGCYSDTRG